MYALARAAARLPEWLVGGGGLGLVCAHSPRLSPGQRPYRPAVQPGLANAAGQRPPAPSWTYNTRRNLSEPAIFHYAAAPVAAAAGPPVRVWRVLGCLDAWCGFALPPRCGTVRCADGRRDCAASASLAPSQLSQVCQSGS